MPLPNCRSSIIGGFLDTVIDLTHDTPSAQQIAAKARQEIAGDFEPELEESRREALAQWATHRWAPICLRLAGFHQTAAMLTQSIDAEAAANVLDDLNVAMPPDCRGNPQNLDDVAGHAAWGAGCAGMQIQKCIGPAFAVKMAQEATRRSHAAGMCPKVLNIGAEAALAASQAMAGRGPTDDQV